MRARRRHERQHDRVALEVAEQQLLPGHLDRKFRRFSRNGSLPVRRRIGCKQRRGRHQGKENRFHFFVETAPVMVLVTVLVAGDALVVMFPARTLSSSARIFLSWSRKKSLSPMYCD